MATTPQTVRTRALAYLRDGRVTVLRSATCGDSPRPYAIQATVRGHRDTYWVELMTNGHWYASCGCEVEMECPHRAAVQLVTGHTPTAAKGA